MEKDSIIHTGKGLLEQIELSDYEIKIDEFSHYFKQDKVLKIKEVGEYSIFVKDDLESVEGVRLYQDNKIVLQSTNVLPSRSGSMIYFDEKVSNTILPNTCLKFSIYKSFYKIFNDIFRHGK